MPNTIGLLQGLLFIVGDEGISVKQCAQALQVSEDEVEQGLIELAEQCALANSGLELVHYGPTYKLVTKRELKEPIVSLLSLSRSRQLSQAALETLAIVAYRQPVTRLEIEEIRGVSCEVMCRKLSALDLIREAGRSESPGRPILYEVTDTFLDGFKLTSLAELPELPEFNEEKNDEFFQ